MFLPPLDYLIDPLKMLVENLLWEQNLVQPQIVWVGIWTEK